MRIHRVTPSWHSGYITTEQWLRTWPVEARVRVCNRPKDTETVLLCLLNSVVQKLLTGFGNELQPGSVKIGGHRNWVGNPHFFFNFGKSLHLFSSVWQIMNKWKHDTSQRITVIQGLLNITRQTDKAIEIICLRYSIGDILTCMSMRCRNAETENLFQSEWLLNGRQIARVTSVNTRYKIWWQLGNSTTACIFAQ